MAGIGVVKVQGQSLAVFGPCAGRPCPDEAGEGRGGMLLWRRLDVCCNGWVEEWRSRSGCGWLVTQVSRAGGGYQGDGSGRSNK